MAYFVIANGVLLLLACFVSLIDIKTRFPLKRNSNWSQKAMQNSLKVLSISQILDILTCFSSLYSKNDKKYYQNSSDDHTDSINVQKFCIISLNSVIEEIGTFWQLLTTFGIENVTRWPKIFFRHLIVQKLVYESLDCWWTIHIIWF